MLDNTSEVVVSLQETGNQAEFFPYKQKKNKDRNTDGSEKEQRDTRKQNYCTVRVTTFQRLDHRRHRYHRLSCG